MTGLVDRQLAPAMALVQLISEHPVRPETTWTIAGGSLRGHVYGPTAGGEPAVRWWAGVLGAEPVVLDRFVQAGLVVRHLDLSVVWRDVQVVIVFTLEDPVVLVPTEVVMGDGTVVTSARLAVAL